MSTERLIGQRIERQQPVPVQRQEVRLPDPGEYHALYARLFLSAVAVYPEIRHEPLDPKRRFSRIGFPENLQQKPRDYNPITWGLSKSERTEAWKDKDFDDAYSEWSENLLGSIVNTTDTERAEFILQFTGKDASDFTNQDIDTLYHTYCDGKSDTTAFVEKSSKIKGKKKQKEWLAKRFFGKDSASVVMRIIELETVIKTYGIRRNNDILYSNFQRVNNPTPRAEYLLGRLFNKFEGLPKEMAPPKPKEDERPAPLKNTPVNPATESGEDGEAEPESTEPQAVRVKEVDLREYDSVLEDLTRELSSETEEYDKKEFIISPRQFADEFIGTIEKIPVKKGTGEIIVNPKRPTRFRLRGLELESGVILDLTVVNRGKGIRIKRDRTRGPEVRLPRGRLPDYEISDYSTKLKKMLNLLSEAWKTDRIHVADGNIELDFNIK